MPFHCLANDICYDFANFFFSSSRKESCVGKKKVEKRKRDFVCKAGAVEKKRKNYTNKIEKDNETELHAKN